MKAKKLSEENWRLCVDSMPIYGIDMIIYSEGNGILMGRRINEPALGKFFVPGGRVYKGETRINAFNRILLTETGLNYDLKESKMIGIYEHFYTTNRWSDKEINTHYIIEARFIYLKKNHNILDINLNAQHSNINWIDLKNINQKDIHEYSNLYLTKVKEILY